MCSIETSKIIGKLFLILAEGERSIEISRQVLSDLKEFDTMMNINTRSVMALMSLATPF